MKTFISVLTKTILIVVFQFFQIKCNQKLNSINGVFEKSNEEIIPLKQKIRFRQRQKLQTELHMQTPGTSSSDYLTECNYCFCLMIIFNISYI